MPDGQRRCRAEALNHDERFTKPPDLHGCEYIVEITSETGLDVAGKPISYSELQAWQHFSGVELTPWESVTIKAMSSAYCTWLVKAQDPACQQPVYTETRSMEEIRKGVDNQIKSILGSRKKVRGKRARKK